MLTNKVVFDVMTVDDVNEQLKYEVEFVVGVELIVVVVHCQWNKAGAADDLFDHLCNFAGEYLKNV